MGWGRVGALLTCYGDDALVGGFGIRFVMSGETHVLRVLIRWEIRDNLFIAYAN